jgi:hypothetical protein
MAQDIFGFPAEMLQARQILARRFSPAPFEYLSPEDGTDPVDPAAGPGRLQVHGQGAVYQMSICHGQGIFAGLNHRNRNRYRNRNRKNL